MIKQAITNFPINHPKLVMALGIIGTLIFLAAFPSLKTDTDPVHMLPQNNHAVTLYNKVKSEFNISDIVALGIKSRDGSTLFTKEGLTKIHQITSEILNIQDREAPKGWAYGLFKKLQFLRDSKNELSSKNIFIKEDVISISTVDDIVKNEKGELLVTPLMKHAPRTDQEAQHILERINSNPMLSGKMISKKGDLVGIFIPLEKGKKDRSYYLGEQVKKIAKKYLGENEEFYFAGLPIAESTFGSEMFVQMGVYAPAAGLVIFLLMLLFFRSVKMVMAPMLVGMMAVIWSMGALIYSGNVIHIMSSMIPIFLLPIAVLDSIHILSNLSSKINQCNSKEEAIKDVMGELFTPMLYTSLTTIVGFSSLASTGIPPVIVFGLTIGFGVFLSWFISIMFIPAYTMLMNDDVLKKFSKTKQASIFIEVVQLFKKLATNYPKRVISLALAIILISIIGVNQIIINDNPVRWFKSNHPIRQADDAMNEKLAGTYMANIYFAIRNEVQASYQAESSDDFEDESDDIKIPTVRSPEVINYIDNVGNFLRSITLKDGNIPIGGTTSIADILRKIGNTVFEDETIPTSKEGISQYLFLYESGDIKKGKDLWKIITAGESSATQMWVYFKTGNNQVMNIIMDKLSNYIKQHPLPTILDSDGKSHPIEIKWSGLMHINNIWQQEMVEGMMMALIGSFIIVFIMMIILFRNIVWGIIAMLPLTITILFIYGLIGFTGKFYDMPIAVLSSLTLGLSIDFAIHFIEHIRIFNRTNFDLAAIMEKMFSGTAQAIWRNVLVISIGFLPLFFASLVPYVTVGSFFFLIMITGGVTTLVLLPAIIKTFSKLLIKGA